MKQKIVVWSRVFPDYAERMRRIAAAVKHHMANDDDAGMLEIEAEIAAHKATVKATPKHEKFWEITLWPDTQGSDR